jgi:hypothetical protein
MHRSIDNSRHDIAEILLKVALKHKKSKSKIKIKCMDLQYNTR